jgi:RNA polymerase sigma factor (sigma-70 family)
MDRPHDAEGMQGAPKNQPRELDSFTQGFVRKCARRLAGRFGIQRHDREEIEQRVYLKIAKWLPAADPDDPRWKAFLAVTVHRHILSIVRDSEAAKRDRRKTCSINVQVVTPEGPVELAAMLHQSEIPSRRAEVDRLDEELAEMALDVADAVESITDPLLREICERLKFDSVSQVARDLDVPRTTINSWLHRVRSQFETRDLKDYL